MRWLSDDGLRIVTSERRNGPWKVNNSDPYRNPDPVPEPEPLPPDDRDEFEKINTKVCRHYQLGGVLPKTVYIDLDAWTKLLKEMDNFSKYIANRSSPPLNVEVVTVATEIGQVRVRTDPAIKKDHILLVKDEP